MIEDEDTSPSARLFQTLRRDSTGRVFKILEYAAAETIAGQTMESTSRRSWTANKE
jgi:hypothetical protein